MKSIQKLGWWISLCVVALSVLGLSGCDQQDKNVEAKVAKLVYVNWAEGVAYSHLAKVVLTDKLGYQVEMTAADVGPAYISVAQGKYDALMESWPLLQKSYLDRFGSKLDTLGAVYQGTQVGLVVPSYVPINTIAQLKVNAAKFNHQIVGIDAGSGVMGDVSEKIIPEYGLDNMKLVASSGPAMTAALGKAIQNKQWIVVTGWVPHWMFSRWDLKFLQQDADKMVWHKEQINILGRKGLATDKPQLRAFLSNFNLTDEQLSGLMLAIKNKQDDQSIDDVARQWVKSHATLVAAWLPQKTVA